MGLEEGVFPHLRSIGEPDELEEERRLAYVAITRAQERLYLSHAWSRTLYGGTQYNPPSRFLDEIPARLVEAIEQKRASRGGRTYGSGGYGYGSKGAGVDANKDRIVEAAMRSSGPGRHTGAEALGIKTGDDVVHAKWGEGVVLQLRGEGDKTEVVINFPSVGREGAAAVLGADQEGLIKPSTGSAGRVGDQHGATGAVGDLVGHAAEDPASAAHALVAHHHEVGLHLVGHHDERIGRIPRPAGGCAS